MKALAAAWMACAVALGLALAGCVAQEQRAATGIPLVDVLSGNYQQGTVPLIDALRGDKTVQDALLTPTDLPPMPVGGGPPPGAGYGPSVGLLPPYQHNTYGPGVHADGTGRPFIYQPANSGDNIPVTGPVQRDGYGLGTHIDQFGRPMRDRPGW